MNVVVCPAAWDSFTEAEGLAVSSYHFYTTCWVGPLLAARKQKFSFFWASKTTLTEKPLPKVRLGAITHRGGVATTSSLPPHLRRGAVAVSVPRVPQQPCRVQQRYTGWAGRPGGRQELSGCRFPPAQRWAVDSDKMQATLGRRFRLLENSNK